MLAGGLAVGEGHGLAVPLSEVEVRDGQEGVVLVLEASRHKEVERTPAQTAGSECREADAGTRDAGDLSDMRSGPGRKAVRVQWMRATIPERRFAMVARLHSGGGLLLRQ